MKKTLLIIFVIINHICYSQVNKHQKEQFSYLYDQISYENNLRTVISYNQVLYKAQSINYFLKVADSCKILIITDSLKIVKLTKDKNINRVISIISSENIYNQIYSSIKEFSIR